MNKIYQLLHQAASGLVAGAREAADHLAAELQAERAHLVRLVILAGAVVLSGAFAAILATTMLVIASPADQRLKVLGVLAAFFFLMLAGLLWGLRRTLRHPNPTPITSGTMLVARFLEAVLKTEI